MADVIQVLRERFLKNVRVDEETGCWIWVGTTDRGWAKYGQFSCYNKNIRAHRAAYELWKLELIPEGMVVRHQCDNPPCVNPDHLILGTYADNTRDMIDRGRQPRGENHWSRFYPERIARGEGSHKSPPPGTQRGSRNAGARLTEADVVEIRRLRAETKLTIKQIAFRYGVYHTTIEAVIYRKNWAHVEEPGLE